MSFVTAPNLPEGRVTTVMLGQRYLNKLGHALTELGIHIISVPDNICVDPRLAGHADLSAAHLGGREIIICRAVRTMEDKLKKEGFEVIVSQTDQNADYPADVGLNGCIVGNNIFCMSSACDERLYGGRNVIDVKQGYAKCSVCVVDERHIISDDESIYKAALKNGIDCLKIGKGAIELNGFDYGFIGGSSFKADKKTVAFTGTLKNHPDLEKITRYIRELGMEIIYLTEEPCFDVGSIIPLKTA